MARPYRNGPGRVCLRLQWSDRRQYVWLEEIGLTPAKSLTLGPLTIPDEYFADFLHGCIDGDGSILVYTDRYHTAKKSSYVYERLYVSLVSASRPFVDWIRATVTRLSGLKGAMQCQRKARGNPIWKLRYSKGESLAVLRWIYYAPDLPSLRRKREAAAPFLIRRARPAVRRAGRPMVI